MTQKNPVVLVATWISHIFDPAIILLFLTVLVIIKSNLSRSGVFAVLLLIPLFLGIPLGYLLWKLKTGEIHDWEITKRKERIKPFLVMLGSLLIDVIIVYFLNNQFLLNFTVFLFFWMLGFLGITLYWKISGHSSINMLAALLLTHWFGLSYWPIFFIVAAVTWARVAKKSHTPWQVVAGLAYSSVIVYCGIRLLGI